MSVVSSSPCRVRGTNSALVAPRTAPTHAPSTAALPLRVCLFRECLFRVLCRLGLYIFGRKSLLENAFELTPVVSQLTERPTVLRLALGEVYVVWR